MTTFRSAARALVKPVAALMLAATAGLAHADAVDTLRDFGREAKSGRAQFTQVVTSPDGARKRQSTGTFEFARPDRFRFDYGKPAPQTIVSDGRKLWLYDPELNQVTTRALAGALGSTPASLLAGQSFDKDFVLSALPAQDGLDSVQALPRAKEGPLQSVRVGFRGKELAALDIVDSFGQRSTLRFTQVDTRTPVAVDRFTFTPPKGADLIEQ